MFFFFFQVALLYYRWLLELEARCFFFLVFSYFVWRSGMEKSNKRGARTRVLFFFSFHRAAVCRLLDSVTERTITDPNICHVNKAALGLLHLLEWLFFFLKGLKVTEMTMDPVAQHQ